MNEPERMDWEDNGVMERVKRALAARAAWPEARSGPVEVAQTHISTVFLTPRFVFKFKRPVNLGFADFTTLAARHHFCQEEIRLNSRLAAPVYLGVAPFYRQGDGFSLAGGELADWCVVMRRLPRQNMLDVRLAQGRWSPAMLARLARLLARFHQSHPALPQQERYGRLETIAHNCLENFDQAAPLVGPVVSRPELEALEEKVRAFLEAQAPLFRQRLEGGRLVDGHGDLRAEHLYVGPPLAPLGKEDEPTAGETVLAIDCVEFTDRFRVADPANEAAFLVMDFTSLGYPQAARHFLTGYLEASGDQALGRLLPFYCCYRAMVRAKVLGYRLGDHHLGPEEKQAIGQKARHFFELAQGYAQGFQPPLLLLVCGLMGTGKSRLAEALAQRHTMAWLNTDQIRKELARQEAAGGGLGDGWGDGLYTPAWHAKTYAELFRRAGRALAAGYGVVLDGSFASRERRLEALELARLCGARLLCVELTLPAEETLARLEARVRGGGAVSDGRPELLAQQAAAFEPVDELPPAQYRRLDAAPSTQALVERVSGWPELGQPPGLFGLPPEDWDWLAEPTE